MLKNLASALFLSERDAEGEDNAPKVKGRVTTTLHKAKEVRPLVEKCVTLARQSLSHTESAQQYATSAERNSPEWKEWRQSEQWQQWNHAIAPAVNARRKAIQLLGDKTAVSILFEEIGPRFADRPGGYTRILRLAGRRLGDAGFQALIEFVGRNDRVIERSEKPSFDDEPAAEETTPEATATDDSATVDDSPADESAEKGADDS